MYWILAFDVFQLPAPSMQKAVGSDEMKPWLISRIRYSDQLPQLPLVVWSSAPNSLSFHDHWLFPYIICNLGILGEPGLWSYSLPILGELQFSNKCLFKIAQLLCWSIGWTVADSTSLGLIFPLVTIPPFFRLSSFLCINHSLIPSPLWWLY